MAKRAMRLATLLAMVAMLVPAGARAAFDCANSGTPDAFLTNDPPPGPRLIVCGVNVSAGQHTYFLSWSQEAHGTAHIRFFYDRFGPAVASVSCAVTVTVEFQCSADLPAGSSVRVGTPTIALLGLPALTATTTFPQDTFLEFSIEAHQTLIVTEPWVVTRAGTFTLSVH
jgi:hypothetical protein